MKHILVAVVLGALVAFAAPAFAASNPFADVPAGHWSYDAVALLASRGVVSGYPDGQYKGSRLVTRYEMASVVARALVYVDNGKASKEDFELVKKLASEYKNEIDAFGVKIADFDSRISGLEKGLKGLRVTGIFWLDAEFGGRENGSTQPQFEYHRARFYIEKQFESDTFFHMRMNSYSFDGNDIKALKLDRLWFYTKLPWDVMGRFGYQTNDWDDEYGLYDERYGGWGDEDAVFTDLLFMGIDFNKDWGKFDLDFWLARNTQDIDGYKDVKSFDKQSYMTYAAKLGYKSEKVKLGIFGRYAKFDGNKNYNSWLLKGKAADGLLYSLDGANIVNYGVYANFTLWEALQLKGTYNHQQFMGTPTCRENIHSRWEDTNWKNADYWTVIAEVDQDLLKLFSLWVQYAEIARGFIHNEDAYNEIGYQTILANYGAENGFATAGYKIFKAAIHRNFTKKLEGYLLYETVGNKSDYDIDRTENWAIGFKYQYTPAIAFQLQYDWRDYGEGNANKYTGREDLFRFRTILSF